MRRTAVVVWALLVVGAAAGAEELPWCAEVAEDASRGSAAVEFATRLAALRDLAAYDILQTTPHLLGALADPDTHTNSISATLH